jgi:hypothetical protein
MSPGLPTAATVPPVIAMIKQRRIPSTRLRRAINPLSWVDQAPPSSFIIVPPMTELLQMSQDPLPCPPQLRNGGSPPAYLSSSLDTPIDPHGWLKTFACREQAKALVEAADKQRCHEVAARAAASAKLALVEEHRCHKAAMLTAASAKLVLLKERHRHNASMRAALSAGSSLADKQSCHEASKHTAVSAELALHDE